MIFGLQIVMLLPLNLGIVTTPFSITFRAVMLISSIFVGIQIYIYPNKIALNIGALFLIIFFLVYSIRFIYDLYILEIEMSPNLGNANRLSQFYFGGIVIPVIALVPFSLKTIVIEKTLFYFSLIQCIAIAYIFFILFGAGIEAFISRYYVATIFLESDLGSPINPITLSRSGGILAVSSIFMTSISKKLKFICLSLGIVLLLLGSSRGPLLAFTICVLIALSDYLLKSSFYILCLKILLFIAIFSMLFIASTFLLDNINLSLINRIIEMVESSSSGEERFHTWTAAINQIIKSPIFGDKIVENYTLTYPHNLFLEVLMSTGILGFIPFIIALYFGVNKAIKLYKNGNKLVPMLLLYLTISVLLSGAIFFSGEFWLILLIVFNLRN